MSNQSKDPSSFESFFDTHYGTFSKDLESRRHRYLRSFRNRLIVTVILLLVLPVIATELYVYVNDHIGDLDRYNLEIMPFIIKGFLLAYVMWPLAQYHRRVRHHNYELRDRVDMLYVPSVSWWNPLTILHDLMVDGWSRIMWLVYAIIPYVQWIISFIMPKLASKIGVWLANSDGSLVVWQRSPLKNVIYHRVFNAFANFTFRPRGMNARINLMQPLLLPPHDEYRAEDNVVGAYHDAVLDLAEAQLLMKYKRVRYNLFHGLFVTVDISEMGVKISREFEGRTALVDKRRTSMDYIHKRFTGFTELHDVPVADKYRLFTTNEAEAKAILTPELMKHVMKLEELFARFAMPKRAWDVQFIERVTRPFRPKNVGKLPQVNEADSTVAINAGVQLSFYDDKMQLTIPCEHNLFEAPSIFEPVLNRAELELIYNMMMEIGALIDVLYTNKRELDEVANARQG